MIMIVMRKAKKVIIRVSIILFLILLLSVATHYILFPQQTTCMLVQFSDIKKENNIYYNRNVTREKVNTLKWIIQQSCIRSDSFWQFKTCDPIFIYCDTEAEFKKFGSPYNVPAITHLKLGEYIVISPDGISLDILSHEITHAELYYRTGFYKHQFKIPTWFDEGLAMQVDYRDLYSEDTLAAKTNHYQTMPDVTAMFTGKQFQSGTTENIMLHYMTAKHIVHQWYTREKLADLLDKINAGKSFAEAYK